MTPEERAEQFYDELKRYPPTFLHDWRDASCGMRTRFIDAITTIRAEALERNVAAENAERNLREVLEDMDYETRGSGICSMVDCILREFVFCSQKYKDRLPARAKREKIEGRRILRALGIPSSEEKP